MDKSEFVDIAPEYYALAVIEFLRKPGTGSVISEGEIHHEYTQDREFGSLLTHAPILKRTMALLAEYGIVVIRTDPFGPPIYMTNNEVDRVSAVDEAGLRAFRENSPLMRKFEAIQPYYRRGWLNQALGNLNQEYVALGVGEEDFANPDAEWEPLAIERPDADLDAAVAAIDEAVSVVEADNGYAVHAAGERAYVASTLKGFSDTLKTGSWVSVGQLRLSALVPLGKVIKRFGESVVGVAAATARQAIIAWAVKRAPELITFLSSFF